MASRNPPADAPASDHEHYTPPLDAINEDTLLTQLDAALLALISRDQPVCGQRLIEALSDDVDCEYAPGSVYSTLADLRDLGILERRELTHRKVYTIVDRDAANDFLTGTLTDLLATAHYIHENTDLETDVTDAEMQAEVLDDLL